MVNNGHRGTDRLRSPKAGALGLFLLSAGGAAWYINPRAGIWPGVLLLSGLAALLLSRNKIWRGRFYDWLLVLFLISAALAVWTGYNQENAWNKYLLLVAAAILFWGFASHGFTSYWVTIGIISAWSVLIATHFLLVHDWQVQPADLSQINQLGERWMAARPDIPLRQVHPNIAGGLLAALLPIEIFSTSYAFRRRKIGAGLLLSCVIGFSSFALLMTSSRAAWMGLGLALGIWLVWEISGRLETSFKLRRRSLLSIFLILLAIGGIILAAARPDSIVNLAGRIPGQPSTGSRLSLYRESLYLVQDFPLFGGGLTSFPGLYSEYILVSPFYFFGYAHNLFLDLLIEQGIIGWFAFSVILFGATALVAGKLWSSRHPSRRLASLRWGAFAGLIVLIFHGLLDDSFYGMEGTPLLFLLPALAIAATNIRRRSVAKSPAAKSALGRVIQQPGLFIVPLLIFFLFGSLYYTRGLSPSTWLANLGAVEMSKTGLVNWPTGKWDEGKNLADYNSPENLFYRSLRINPDQHTALYRLGLLSMLERDYSQARSYLERALALNPTHPGIRKSLGFTYVWLGDYQDATRLLDQLDDTSRELTNYKGWWQNHGRPDLADRADAMLDYLKSNQGSAS